MGSSCVENLLNAIGTLFSDFQKEGILEDAILQYKIKKSDVSMELSKQLINTAISNLENAIANFKIKLNSDQEPLLETQWTIKSEEDSNSELNTLISKEKDPKLVQIRVDRNEMNRRINAFIVRKRKEVDEWNVQEFCSHPSVDEINPDWEHQFSCARVDAVFVPRSGSKSHVKVSKVVNQWGPQTRLTRPPSFQPSVSENVPIKTEQLSKDGLENKPVPAGLEERLKNMESHLKLKSSYISQDVYTRLKQLENRILFLEGLSPDYFTTMQTNFQQRARKPVSIKEERYTDWNLAELNNRIQTLKDSLRQKAQQFDPDVSEKA